MNKLSMARRDGHLKNSYDPDNVFRVNQNVAPAATA